MVKSKRIMSRWWVVPMLLGLTLGGLIPGLVMGLIEDGPGRTVGWVTFALSGLHLVALVRMFVLPRRRRKLVVDDAGALTIVSPALLVWPLALAWGGMPVLAVGYVVLMIVDPDSIEVPKAASGVVVGMIVLVPEWFRLVTGRRRRWRLVLTDEGLSYRGYSTDIDVPWSKVKGTWIQRTRPFGVVVDLKGTRPNLVLQEAVFDLPAEQFVEEIENRLRAAGRPISRKHR